MSSGYYLEKKRLQQAIEADPRNIPARLALADLLQGRGYFQAAERQRVKARQSKYFNPEFNYAAKLDKYGLVVVTLVDGWVVQVVDDPYEYWADPTELQRYLTEIPESEWHAGTMPLGNISPPEGVLEKLASREVLGGLYELPEGWLTSGPGKYLKCLGDDCWLFLRTGERPIFFGPESGRAYRFRERCVRKIE